ncbi:extracellular solute-binding protein [Patescibacteria group bacterium]|nr:extracellular solute-binding protein [Patescibacteria group bacterium]
MKPFSRLFSGLTAGVLALSLFGAGCTQGPTPQAAALAQPVSLNVWGVIDDESVYESSIRAYQAQHPNVTINFRRLTLNEYESELVNGMAEDRGPDIFLIHNDWTQKYLSKMSSMPASVTVGVPTTQGTVQKTVVWNASTVSLMTNTEFQNTFVDTIARDTMRTVDVSADGTNPNFKMRIVGVPTFIDSMALYYNRSLLNVAGIALPPQTWDEFQDNVRKMTKLDPRDPTKVTQSGAAIGTGSNVQRSPDLLAALMMQNGAEMTSNDGALTFQMIPAAKSGSVNEPPAIGAMRFYADFADPSKDVYTWNLDQQNSLDAFIQGKTAFYFGYAYDQDVIKSRAPQLNLGLTKLPQISGLPQKNVANYWYWTVSKKSKQQTHAWNFLNFLAQKTQQQKISAASGRPSPRRDVLAEQLRDEKIGVFASQVLTSFTWYQGRDPKTMEQAFIDVMDKIAKKEVNFNDAMSYLVERVSQTY